MNFSKFKKVVTGTMYAIAVTFAISFAMYGGYLVGAESNLYKAENAALQTALRTERTTLSDHEVKIYLNAQALLGELGTRYVDEWPHVQSAIFTRSTDLRWPMTIAEVLLEKRPNGRGCMVDAMCDSITENLLTDEGVVAREYAADALAQFAAGEFVLTHSGHSWAKPAAAEGHAYFEGLSPVAEGIGHIYFADAPTRPQARPDCETGCVSSSIRPRARPEYTIQQKIKELLASL